MSKHSLPPYTIIVLQCMSDSNSSTFLYSDFASDDGSRRMLELAQELEEVFPTYQSGQRVTPVHTHHRMLSCATTFKGPDCAGSCSCSSKVDLAKCKARQLKCKAQNVQGLNFPILQNPSSALGLLSGEDVELMEFYPPPLTFSFDEEVVVVLYTPPSVQLILSFGVSVTVEYALVSP